MNTTLLTEMRIRCETAHLEQPLDIQRMLEHNRAIGRNLTVVTFAMGATNNLTYFLDALCRMTRTEKGDFSTLRELVSSQLAFYGYRYLNYYAMNDFHTLLLKFALAVKDAENFEELYAYLRSIQTYAGQMSYWIDLAIPWSGLARKYDELMQPDHP